jgi:hypothetical protein
MASAVSTQKLFSRMKIEAGIHVPPVAGAANTATGLGYVDLRDYDGFAVVVNPVVVTGIGVGITLVEIVAADTNTGGNATAIKATAALTMNANTYYAALECTAEEIAQIGRAAGYALRYVAARITATNANCVCSTTYLRGLSKNEYLNLTAAVQS